MSENLVNKIGECEQDNLIARLFPRALTMGIKVAAGAGLLKRGTLLAVKEDGTYVICGKKVTSGEGESATTTTYANPSAILAADIDASGAAAVAAVAYRSGNFNPNAVIVAEDHTLSAADKDALRKYDIVFTDMMEA